MNRSRPQMGSSAFPAGPVRGGRVTPPDASTTPTPPVTPVTSGAVVAVVAPGRIAGTFRRPQLWWFGAGTGVVLVIGLVVLLTLTLNGGLSSGAGLLSQARQPRDQRPPLARLCPQPTGTATGTPSGELAVPSPSPAGTRRTVDSTAGISYQAYGSPWRDWPFLWRMGTLQVSYGVGQYFVTESYPGGDYYASVLSAAVPATVNDSITIDIECVGQQVASDVRAEYYPQPNTMERLRAGRTTLGGRPAWVTVFRLHFTEAGLHASDELAGVALVDVGRPTAAVLYVSVPGTHREWDHIVNEVINSIQPT